MSISDLENREASIQAVSVLATNTDVMKNHRGMRFTCDRSWEEMSPIEGGRFCNACQKPVIDFSGWSRADLIAYFQARPDTCGQFEPHQVDPTLVPIERVGGAVRRGFFATLAALAIGTIQAQDKAAPAPTEQVHTKPTARSAQRTATDHLTSHPRKPWPVDEAKANTPKKTARNRVYLASRFPFVIVRRKHVKGRVMGCPTF